MVTLGKGPLGISVKYFSSHTPRGNRDWLTDPMQETQGIQIEREKDNDSTGKVKRLTDIYSSELLRNYFNKGESCYGFFTEDLIIDKQKQIITVFAKDHNAVAKTFSISYEIADTA